jgi:hypothetical protein
MLSKSFILAGRASFVVENPKGESVTVKVSKSRPKTNPYTNKPYPETFFVSLRHNNHPWQYIGRLNGDRVVATANVQSLWSQPDHAHAIRVAQWGLTRIFTQTDVPQGYRLAHTGHCGKCGKLLRDAESVALGLGPVCRG